MVLSGFTFIQKRSDVSNGVNYSPLQIVKAHYNQKSESSHGHYPAGVVALTVPPDAVDINLEPNKDKVLLKDEVGIRMYCCLPVTYIPSIQGVVAQEESYMLNTFQYIYIYQNFFFIPLQSLLPAHPYFPSLHYFLPFLYAFSQMCLLFSIILYLFYLSVISSILSVDAPHIFISYFNLLAVANSLQFANSTSISKQSLSSAFTLFTTFLLYPQSHFQQQCRLHQSRAIIRTIIRF